MCLVTLGMSDSLRPYGPLTCHAPQSMGFSRQEYWCGLLCPSPGNLPNPGINPGSPALQTVSLLLSHWGSPKETWGYIYIIYSMVTTVNNSVLCWPKSLFRFFHKILQKNLNELLVQLNMLKFAKRVDLQSSHHVLVYIK